MIKINTKKIFVYFILLVAYVRFITFINDLNEYDMISHNIEVSNGNYVGAYDLYMDTFGIQDKNWNEVWR